MNHFLLRKFPILLSTIGMASLTGWAADDDYVQVYFTERATLVQEHGTPRIAVELSRSSALPIEVPLSIDKAATTASAASSATERDGDYYIADRDAEGVVWDAEAGSGTLTFAPGQTRHELTVQITADREEEDDETIVFRMDAENVTVARPVQPQSTTLTIQDNDPVRVLFDDLAYSVNEGNAFSVDLVLTAPSFFNISVPFTVTPESATATEADLDLDDFPTVTATISAGSARSTVTIPTAQDLDIEGTERFTITMGTPAEVEGSPLQGDDRTVALAILDNDPTNAHFDLSTFPDEFQEGVEISEYSTFSLPIALTAPAPSTVNIPVTLGGTATRGDDSNSDTLDYDTNLSEEDTITIAAGQTTSNLTFTISSDIREEENETITVSLGTPVHTGTGTIGLTDPSEYTITIEDDDPVSLSFGQSNGNFDPEADEPEDEFIPSSGYTVGEPDGTITIPIIVSDRHGRRTNFQIEVLEEGTTATMRRREANWSPDDDFYVASHNINQVGESARSAVGPGQIGTGFTIILNDDTESRPVYGEETPDDVEEDETIRLRISEVDTDTSGVRLGQHTEFTLTIREFPDVDVTHLFTGTTPLDLNPPLNPKTNLHEIEFAFAPDETVPADAFRGYRSYKIAFRPGEFDADNPESDANDLLVRSVGNSSSANSWYRFVDPPFEPRYPTGTDQETLIKGQPLTTATFTDENADIRINEYYFLQQLNLDVVDPSLSRPRTGYADLDEPFNYLIEFSNQGYRDFDMSRLTKEGGVKIYLTRDDVPSPGAGSVLPTDSIRRFLPQEDGSVFIEVENPNRAPISVEYLDEEGVWRHAQAPVLRNLGTRLYWIDHGPPRTHPHPAEVDFRLYRFSTAN